MSKERSDSIICQKSLSRYQKSPIVWQISPSRSKGVSTIRQKRPSVSRQSDQTLVRSSCLLQNPRRRLNYELRRRTRLNYQLRHNKSRLYYMSNKFFSCHPQVEIALVFVKGCPKCRFSPPTDLFKKDVNENVIIQQVLN